MDDVLHADAIKDETVRVELNGETHDIDEETARQLARDLDVAVAALDTDQEKDVPEPETDDEFVDRLQNARHVGSGTAERIAQEYDSVEELAKADAEEIEAFDHVGPTARLHIQDEFH